MRFDKAKKAAIVQYLLEKMEAGTPDVVKLVSQTFAINPDTVHNYINELLKAGTIRRIKRGTYELATRQAAYTFRRSQGELKDEQIIFDRHLRPHFEALPDNIRRIWDYILGEIINNVIDHSNAEELYIQVRQTSLTTTVFIIDNGIGIFKKIRDHFSYESLDDAICELFKGKLTTDPDNHSGEGIFFSSKLADIFRILSDEKIFSNDKYAAEFLRDMPGMESGTAVMIQLSNTSNKVAAEVFDQFAEADGGFTVTTIPLKNIFETAPVSRSQAKRVCQRLEQFKEVILDFQGLDWMGQGFAHQLFVVFRRNHPDIRLTPVNMSPGVAKMYTHVTGEA